jgi:calcium-dependent protein kinase
VQLLRAINYYNDFYIVHRDLKPENVLFSKKNQISSLYMIDFGIASKCTKNSNSLHDKVGTVNFPSPTRKRRSTTLHPK